MFFQVCASLEKNIELVVDLTINRRGGGCPPTVASVSPVSRGALRTGTLTLSETYANRIIVKRYFKMNHKVVQLTTDLGYSVRLLDYLVSYTYFIIGFIEFSSRTR